MIAVLNWCLDHWFLIFVLSALGVFESVRDFFVGTAEAIAGIGQRRHERRMEELRLQTQVTHSGQRPAVTPGPCVHRNVRPVVGIDGKVKAWLCQCDTPASRRLGGAGARPVMKDGNDGDKS
jgi:hypothetical protein